MNLAQIPVGKKPPYDINVIVEIPQGGVPVKYELDRASGALFVNRFLHTAMFYPANYGFIPHTLAEDGDPCDALVVTQMPVVAGAVIRARPIGALLMRDQAGCDDKILTVPVDDLNPFFRDIRNYTDLPSVFREQIAHFFQHYKDLEANRWSQITDWVDAEAAANLIRAAIARHPA